MSVRIRLRRIGKKSVRKPFFRIVVIERTTARDGRCIEEIGFYDPVKKPAVVKLDKTRYNYWMKCGAQPSRTVYNLAKKVGE